MSNNDGVSHPSRRPCGPPQGEVGDGLKPSSQGKRIAFDGPGRTVIDGSFAATRELVAGFWLWEVKDMDEAVAWVKRCPNPMPGPSEIEIRPLNEMADLR